MSSRLLRRTSPLLVLAVVALGLLGARSADPGPDREVGPAFVAHRTDGTHPAVRAGALVVLAAAGAGLVAARAARPLAPRPVSVPRARSEALTPLRRRGPPAGRGPLT
jgi:hypothetical protein